MAKYDSRIVAVLVTVIIHLIAGIIFIVVQIGGLNVKEKAMHYEIALQSPPDPLPARLIEPRHVYSVEQVVKGDQDLQNIARNIANQPDVKINKDDYIDKVKDELIKSGKLGKDNYIDEQKKERENTGVVSDGKAEEKKPRDKDKKSESSNDLASKYAGPTRIYYNLPGRVHTYLPLPIYKCEGAGKVVLTIEVNPKGEVTGATVITSESTANDPCLFETAVNAALISRFNPDINAVKNQSGTLTYHFVAQ
ncbi:MAG TPA: energy transducer TonB [Bacteroidales bacterium]|nr:energy transducer TonB [Bacteroidales bacterium]